MQVMKRRKLKIKPEALKHFTVGQGERLRGQKERGIQTAYGTAKIR